MSPSRRRVSLERLAELSYSELFLFWIGLNVCFGIAYFSLSIVAPAHGPSLPQGLDAWGRLLDSIYFSIITATSIGYGDIVPLGFSKILSMVQAVTALMVFAILVTKLVTRRQDVALADVHRIAFEGMFYSVRQGFYTVRKDCDRLIHEVQTQKTLQPRDWSNFSSALLQAQTIAEEIPVLYQSHAYSPALDAKRELLLLDSVQRTLERFDHLLTTLDDAKIKTWKTATYKKPLQSFLAILDQAIKQWQKTHKKNPQLIAIVHTQGLLKKKVK